MKITVLCVGKIKEKFYSDAICEYAKRLKRFADFTIIEVPDERIPENASAKEELTVKEREGEKLISKIPSQSFVIGLCIEGNLMSSTELAKTMSDAYLSSSNITFIIGGSLGLSDVVKSRCNLKLSFGRMTLPHQLMRGVLSEQIYRAFKILHNENYHK